MTDNDQNAKLKKLQNFCSDMLFDTVRENILEIKVQLLKLTNVYDYFEDVLVPGSIIGLHHRPLLRDNSVSVIGSVRERLSVSV